MTITSTVDRAAAAEVPAPPIDLASYVASNRPALLRAALGITRDHHDAEDLLQAVLAKMTDRWDGIRDSRAAGAYLRRAMRNQHTSWHRTTSSRLEVLVGEAPEPPSGRVGHDDLPGDSSSAAGEVWEAVLTLPPRQRATVVLRYYEELSEAETASVLGCSRGTVKSNTARGLAALRLALTHGQLAESHLDRTHVRGMTA